MKKFIYVFTTLMILAFFAQPMAVTAREKMPVDEQKLSPEAEAQLKRITQRVEEIRHMDKSDLSSTERKALRKELRDMKDQARAITGGGVYLSVGAIIIIILLLILIL